MTACSVQDLLAHVPVDMFDIVNGPSLVRCFQIKDELETAEWVEQEFTLKTLASNTPFRRTLRIYNIYAVEEDGSFTFTAGFSGRTVSGLYQTKKRTGWFNLD